MLGLIASLVFFVTCTAKRHNQPMPDAEAGVATASGSDPVGAESQRDIARSGSEFEAREVADPSKPRDPNANRESLRLALAEAVAAQRDRPGFMVPRVDQLLASDLDLVTPHTRDLDANVRRLAFVLLAGVALQLPEGEGRRQWVDQIVSGLDDDDASVRDVVTKVLTKFQARDFSDLSKRALLRHVSGDSIHSSLPRVVGVARVEGALDRMLELAETGRSGNWNALVSAARLGDEGALGRVMDGLDQLFAEESEFVVVRRLRDLAFTGRPSALERVRAVVFSDSSGAAPVGRDEIWTGSQASLAIAVLAQLAVPGFPFEADRRITYSRLGDAEIETTREWLRQDANWKRILEVAAER